MTGKVEGRIVEVLYDAYPLALTIREISKRLAKAYPHIHTVATELLEEGVLSKMVVGNAYACSLDCSNEKTRALLVIIEHDHTRSLLEKNKIPSSVIDASKRLQQEKSVEAAWYVEDSLVILLGKVSGKHDSSLSKLPVKSVVVTRDSLTRLYPNRQSWARPHAVLAGVMTYIDVFYHAGNDHADNDRAGKGTGSGGAW
jgi:hypothetical protein